MSKAKMIETIDKLRVEARKTQPANPTHTHRSNNMAKKVSGDAETKKPKKVKTEKTAAGYTAGDMANDLGMSPVMLRRGLRETKAKKPGSRWAWESKNHPDVKALHAKLKDWHSSDSKKKSDKPAKVKKAAAAKKPKSKSTKKTTASE